MLHSAVDTSNACHRRPCTQSIHARRRSHHTIHHTAHAYGYTHTGIHAIEWACSRETGNERERERFYGGRLTVWRCEGDVFRPLWQDYGTHVERFELETIWLNHRCRNGNAFMFIATLIRGTGAVAWHWYTYFEDLKSSERMAPNENRRSVYIQRVGPFHEYLFVF